MKNLLKFSLIFALAFFMFSCSNDNTDVIPDDESTNTTVVLKTSLTAYARNAVSTNQSEYVFENNDESNGDCYTIDFPYTLTDGQTQTVINNQDELNAYMQSLGGNNNQSGGNNNQSGGNNNPSGGNVAFVFPVTITMADGSTVVISDEMGFIAAIEDCIGDIAVGNECFTFNFPLNVETVDGSIVTVNDELELYSVSDVIGFSYPISVTTDNGVVTINDGADFDALYNDCYDIDPCGDCGTNCFEIVYPINLVNDDGTVTTVNDDDEFYTFLGGLAGNAYFVPTYPMNIEYGDGTQTTINSDDELVAALADCN